MLNKKSAQNLKHTGKYFSFACQILLNKNLYPGIMCGQVRFILSSWWKVDTPGDPTTRKHPLMGSQGSIIMQPIRHAEGNYRDTVVKEIAHVRFTALTNLNIESNQIKSIEGLPIVYMPHLRALYLYDNRITSVRAFRKAAWPALQTLQIYSNHFRDGKVLTEGGFPLIRSLSVYNSWGYDKNSFTQNCFPVKIQASSLEQLSICKNKFCFGRSIEKVNEERWPGVYMQ